MLLTYPDLKYALVYKRREKGRVVEAVQWIVFGDPKEVMGLLGADAGGKINTAYIEQATHHRLWGCQASHESQQADAWMQQLERRWKKGRFSSGVHVTGETAAIT